MLFFTIINALVLVAIILFVPSVSVRERLSYGTQLSVLKKKITWYSIAAIALIVLALVMMAEYGQNTMQYMVTYAAPEAPDFANGLFLLSANLGTTIGAVVCGSVITALDTRYSVLGSLLFLIVGIMFVALRIRAAEPGNNSRLKRSNSFCWKKKSYG